MKRSRSFSETLRLIEHGEVRMAHQKPGADARGPRDVFVHESADVQSRDIGSDTKIWQYTIVLGDARIGRNCNVGAHCFIENDVKIGDDVTVKCGVYIWDGVEVEDGVFIGPNVTFTNDKHPKSKAHPFKLIRTTIKKGASLGANATIVCGVTVGEKAMIGAGSVVTKDVPAGETWVGNPAAPMGKGRQG